MLVTQRLLSNKIECESTKGLEIFFDRSMAIDVASQRALARATSSSTTTTTTTTTTGDAVEQISESNVIEDESDRVSILNFIFFFSHGITNFRKLSALFIAFDDVAARDRYTIIQ